MNLNCTGWPIVAFAASLWGTDQLIRPRLFAAGLASAQIVFAEHALLSMLFLPFIITKHKELAKLTRQDWYRLAFIAWAGSAVATFLLTQAYALGSPLTATLLQKTQPIYAVLLAGVILKEKRNSSFWWLFAGACIATYLISFGLMNPLIAIASPSAPAALCALGAAGLWGACTVAGRALITDISPALLSGMRFLLALPILAIMSAKSDWHIFHHLIEPKNALYLGLIVLIPDVLGMTLYYAGLRTTPASIATVAELSYPASALLIGIIFMHQTLNIGQWIGLLLLIVCLQLLNSTKSVQTTPETVTLKAA